MPKEIVVDWTTVNGAGKASVFFFGTGSTITAQRAALGAWLVSVRGSLTTVTSYAIRQTGRVLDDASGALVGSWTEATGFSGSGASATQPVADASQILFQWRTGNIVNGRYLRGRTFIPGLPVGQLTGGNLTGAQVTGLQAAGNTLVGAGVELGVWHRPTSGSGGVFFPASSCTVWPEMAVLRRRRG